MHDIDKLTSTKILALIVTCIDLIVFNFMIFERQDF